MSQIIKSTALPAAMDEKLRSIRRRQTVLVVGRALAIGVSVLIGAMLLAMVVDWWLTLFSPVVRTILTATSLGLAVAACLATGVRPLLAALGWKSAAASADEHVPELEERWTTVASFAVSERQPTTTEGRAMLEQVTSEAIALGRLVKPQHVARPTAVKPAALTLAGCLLVLAGFLAIDWTQTSVLLRRFWSPAALITATQLRNVTGDVTVPRGESLDLVTEQSGRLRESALLTLQYDSGTVDVFELQSDEEQLTAFQHSLRTDDSFRYRVRAGDGQTEWHTVTVIDYPALADVQFKVTFPEYVDRPPYEKTLIPGRVRVAQGSRLELAMKPLSELERLELTLTFPAEEETEIIQDTLALAPDADGWYRFESQLLEDVSLSPALFNAHGLTNEDRSVCRIQVIPDQAPVARVISPTDEMAVAVDEVIDIQFEAHDDHGIARAELVVYDESLTEAGVEPRILSVQPIPLGDQRLEKHVLANTQLDLKELNLEEGMQVSYAVRVSDNRQVQFSPDAMMAQRTEARPGETAEDDEQSVADASHQPGALANDPSDQTSDPPDSLGNALADARSSTTGRAPQSESDASVANDAAAGDADTPHREADTSEQSQDTPSGAAGADADDQSGDNPKVSADESGAGGQPQSGSEDQPASEPSTSPNRMPPDGDRAGNGNAAVAANGSADGENTDATTRNENPTTGTVADTPGDRESAADEVASNGESQSGRQSLNVASNKESQSGDNPSESTTGKPDGTSETPNSVTPSDDRESGVAETDTQDSDGESRSDSDEERMLAQTDSDRNADDAGNQSNRDAPQAGESTQVRSDDPTGDESNSSQGEPQPPLPFALNAQQAQRGQNTETSRRTLKITERMAALAAAENGGRNENMEIRDRVVAIDRMLAGAELGLTRVVQREIPDSARSDQFTILDEQLGRVETYIAELREETKDEQFAFVGLQMVDIGRTHVTPARDRVFVAIRDASGAHSQATDALQHVVRARELLAALLERYDEVVRERQLADDLDEAFTMYEVYVEKMQQLMREARQNRNPLERKMGIIEVDQDYLDRYAEVLTLRREMLAEFARMLADDPRLLARYMDLIKRRRSSLREQLTELAERQYDASTEVSGWLAANDDQRRDLWMLVAEFRLQAATTLARDAAELSERLDKQMPLVLDPEVGTAAQVIVHAQDIAGLARDVAFDADRVIQNAGLVGTDSTLLPNSERLVWAFGELDAALDRLNFENEDEEEVTSYVTGRLLESRTVADQADSWLRLARFVSGQQYHGMAEVDQEQIAIATELLRVEMLNMEDELIGEFQQQLDTDLPGEIVDMVRELHRIMEGITFNQEAATFALSRDRLETAEVRQAAALVGFDVAEELFDQIRRAVVNALDEYDPPDPNIADLEDPTLDEFLADLEREPDIEAQLGIPNRLRNLRVIADSLLYQQDGEADIGASMDAAIARAREAMRRQRNRTAGDEEEPQRRQTEEERERQMAAEEMQEMIEESLAAVRERMDDPATTAEERRRLEQMAENLQRMREQAGATSDDARNWERLAQSDEAREILRALALGQPIPDQQWNRLMSTLEDGLWQVQGRTPPEDYRQAIEQYQERIRQLVDAFGDDAL